MMYFLLLSLLEFNLTLGLFSFCLQGIHPRFNCLDSNVSAIWKIVLLKLSNWMFSRKWSQWLMVFYSVFLVTVSSIAACLSCVVGMVPSRWYDGCLCLLRFGFSVFFLCAKTGQRKKKYHASSGVENVNEVVYLEHGECPSMWWSGNQVHWMPHRL